MKIEWVDNMFMNEKKPPFITPVIGEKVEAWYAAVWMPGTVLAVNTALGQFSVNLGNNNIHMLLFTHENIDWRRVKEDAPTTKIKLDRYDIVHTTSYNHPSGYRTGVEKSESGAFYSVVDVGVVIEELQGKANRSDLSAKNWQTAYEKVCRERDENAKVAEERVSSLEKICKARWNKITDLSNDLSKAQEKNANLSAANELLDDSRKKLEDAVERARVEREALRTERDNGIKATQNINEAVGQLQNPRNYWFDKYMEVLGEIANLKEEKDDETYSNMAWLPIREWATSHKDAHLGCSVPELVMELIRKEECGKTLRGDAPWSLLQVYSCILP